MNEYLERKSELTSIQSSAWNKSDCDSQSKNDQDMKVSSNTISQYPDKPTIKINDKEHQHPINYSALRGVGVFTRVSKKAVTSQNSPSRYV